MRRFYVDSQKITGQTAVITGTDVNHIRKVLRLKPGDKIILFDGRGFEFESKIEAESPEGITVTLNRRADTVAESPVEITVAQAYLKDKKMDSLIRQITELGITRWIPFMTQRSVPRPDKERLLARSTRWKKIALEALKQCRRSRGLEIGDVRSFEQILDFGSQCDLKIIFWESATNGINFNNFSAASGIKKILMMLGPEGGFTSEEVNRARASGFVSASLGPRILRAETATIAACSLLQYIFGDMR